MATPPVHVEKERPSLDHDVDAAHARIRSHQASLDSINSRMDGNERRIDRLERRLDDQSATLTDLATTTHATQNEVHSQTTVVKRAADRVEMILDRLNNHITTEQDMEHAQTLRFERLHRTIIRGITVLAAVAGLLLVLTNDYGLVEPLAKLLTG